ncbi:MAG TPA: GNAT family N-acetyltransferase [Thermoplasmata archaeon]|nr:GNAT family N-acetyltransferase [Thermoplasmata archaeon]
MAAYKGVAAIRDVQPSFDARDEDLRKRDRVGRESRPVTKRLAVRVRLAGRGDVSEIVRVHNASIDASEDLGFGTPREAHTFANVGRLSAAWRAPNVVQKEQVFAAELDGRVVGYVTVEDREEDLELVNVDVARDLQGRGIGTALVRFVEDRAKALGRRGVTLGTSRNAAGVPWKSLPWWKHLGYRITHEEENDWTRSIGPGVREIRMRKDLG